jgi:hypothetical protein
VLEQSNPDAPRHPASLTKIMTLYLLFERLGLRKIKLDTPLKVSAKAAGQPPSTLGLKAGQSIAVEDAIKAVVTRSANDAAVVVAENLAGDEGRFAKLMTMKPRSLGMSRTTYVNASGLPNDDQITTARDQALLGRAIQERYPSYLRAAREAGSKALRAAAEGNDPASAKKRTNVDSVGAAVEQFLDRHVNRNYRTKPRREAERLLRLYVVEPWGGRKVSEIKRADVRNVLERILGRGTPIAANRVYSLIRGFFNWCLEQEIIEASPCTGLKAPAGKEGSRDRVLNDDELRRVWSAAEKMGEPYNSIVRLLILTGQRSGEVLGMQWEELNLNGRLWTLPRERVKNDRRHEVPLSAQAITILESVPRISDRYVFSV